MIAIETRFLGPTNTKGSRIIATTCNGHRLVQSADHASRCPHQDAAEALRDREEWTSNLIKAGTKSGYVFVFTPENK